MAAEYLLPPKTWSDDKQDESLGGFVTRRFGRETYRRLVQPLIGGIYTGDPDKLSLRATMPRFQEMEQKHGSVIRGVLRQARQATDRTSSGARYSMFVAPRDGMSSLVRAIADRLPAGSIQLRRPCIAVRPEAEGGWRVEMGGDAPETRVFDAILLATPAPATARLVERLDWHMAQVLRGIEQAGCAIVSLAFRREDVGHALDGFGFVVPRDEHRKILSGSFSSIKYPGRAPDDSVLIRVFVGGALQPELLDLTDDRLLAMVQDELAELIQARGTPQAVHISRRPHSMPQYHVGHNAAIADLFDRARQFPQLFLAGNSYHGVGMPHCIHSGEQAAEQLHQSLQTREHASV
jgi:oxygen-dependent protoporphyrinogen oxidase